jgi:hypothetical protein
MHAQGYPGQAMVLGQVQMVPGQIGQVQAHVLAPGPLAPGLPAQHLYAAQPVAIQPAPPLYVATAACVGAHHHPPRVAPVRMPSPLAVGGGDGGGGDGGGGGGGNSPESEIEDLD